MIRTARLDFDPLARPAPVGFSLGPRRVTEYQPMPQERKRRRPTVSADVPQLLRDLRLCRWRQARVAAELKVSVWAVAQWSRGRCKPRADTLLRLVDLHGRVVRPG